MGNCTSAGGKAKGGGGAGGAGGAKGREKNAPALDKELIIHANAAGTFIDYGDAGVRTYNSGIEEINGMDMTASEKNAAIKELHSLVTAELEAESKAFTPYSAGVGPARFNRSKMIQAGDKAAAARQKVLSFMDGLRDEQKKKARQREQRALTDAVNKAIADKALSFTINGQTWTRKTTRSKTFTAR